MNQTKRLSELKPGDHMWFEGELEKIVSIESAMREEPPIVFSVETGAVRLGSTVTQPDAYEIEFESGNGGTMAEGDHWAVPSDEEVSRHYSDRTERRRIWLESRPAFEAKCMAAARRVALAMGKDPEESERQMRAKLDGDRRAFEEECGE